MEIETSLKRETMKLARKSLLKKATVDESGAPVNLLFPTLKALTTFDRNGLDLVLEFTALGMPTWTTQFEEWVFDLTKRNMKTLYDETAKKGFSEWRWSESKKREEIFSHESRFIIARERATRDIATRGTVSQKIEPTLSNEECGGHKNISQLSRSSSDIAAESGFTSASSLNKDAVFESSQRQQLLGRPLAFISFRLVSEGPLEVLYVYELQLEPETHRKGLGRHLMTTVELVARTAGFQSVMLTVLKKNVGAVDFYTKKMKYEIDDDSPSQNGDKRAPYEILSKVVDRKGFAERMQLVTDGVIDGDDE
jgi:ribosomal protein S18 acetylase RimI-like enzyme